MPFDGIVLRAVTNELESTLINGKIEKISQLSRDDVLMNIYSRGSKYRLIFSANASYPRVHLSNTEIDNPPIPFNFCILLRKHLLGSKITQFSQPGLERILEIKFEGTDEIGDPITRFLVIEIMGKHSNIILLNHNRKIIDAIKHIDSEISRIREILPGRDYIYPNTQNKLSIFDTKSDKKIREIFSEKDRDSIPKSILDSFSGFSPFASNEFAAEVFSTINSKDYSDIASKVLLEIKQALNSNSTKPYISYTKNAIPSDIHCLFPHHFDDTSIHNYDSISKALDEYYLSKSVNNKMSSKKAELINSVNKRLEKCLKRIQIQTKNISDSSEKDNFKLFGELITSNLYRIIEGMEEIKVINYYDPNSEEIVIPLNPNIPPANNAQSYYKKYSKIKKTFESATVQLSQLEREKYYFENLLFQIEETNYDYELGEIKSELINEGIISSDVIKNKKIPVISVPAEFISSDGFTILVGKNNRQNDYLTFKTASRTDIWLHTRNIPGSHVVIRAEKKEVPEASLLEACLLAAYHSKARTSTHVPVDYTFVKHVKKPGGAKPGFVIYENFKTITVDPHVSIIEKLQTKKANHHTHFE